MKKKIKWLIDYYWVHAVVTIFALIVIITFVKSVFWPEPVKDICVMILSDEITKDQGAGLEGELEELTGRTVEVTIYGVTENYGTSAFAIKLTSDQLDFVLAPYNESIEMTNSGYLQSQKEIEHSKLYLGIPQNARCGKEYDMTGEYLMSYFSSN